MPKANKGVFIQERNGIKWWRYDFSESGQRYRGWIHPVHGMSKRTANTELKKVIADVISNKTLPGIRRQNPNVKRIVEDYLKYLEEHYPSTHVNIKYSEPRFRFFYGKQINDKVIEEYRQKRQSEKTKRGTPTSDSTVNRELQYLRAAFNQAKVSPNPFNRFRAKREAPRVRYLSQDEIAALLNSASESKNHHLLTIIELALLTGMRKMEILRLHRDEIDFMLGIIIIGAEREKNRKNKMIPLPGNLIADLLDLAEKSESGYLFENKVTGKPYTDIKNPWKKALQDAEIEDFRFHDLRHYAEFRTMPSS
jgi:integrase